MDQSHFYNPDIPYNSSRRDNIFDLTIVANNNVFGGVISEIYVEEADYESSNKSIATRTGYYLKKWMNSNIELTPRQPNSTENHYYAFLDMVKYD